MPVVADNHNYNLVSLGTKFDTRITELTSWRPREAYRVAALPTDYTPIINYPRPDSDSPSYAFYRVAHPSVPYRIPITVSLGAAPFKYQLISAPTGAILVGREIQWASPVIGTHSFVCRITDSDLKVDTVIWSVVVSTNAHIFIDIINGNDTTGNGSYESPYQSITKVYPDEATDATFQNKVLVFRTGTYLTPSTYVKRLGDVKPIAWQSFPGEQVTVDLQWTDRALSARTSGAAVVGITLKNAPADNSTIKDSFFISSINSGLKCFLFYKNIFDGLKSGDSVTYPTTYGNDNPGVFRWLSAGSENGRIHANIIENTIKNYGPGLSNFFSCKHLVVEGNVFIDRVYVVGNGNALVQMKGTCYQTTFRLNVATQGFISDVSAGAESMRLFTEHSPNNIQMYCYNKLLRGADSTPINTALVQCGSSDPTFNSGLPTSALVFRNTLIGGRIRASDFVMSITASNNIVTTDASQPIYPSGVNMVMNNVDNLVLPYALSPVDANGNLVGSNRDNYLGVYGVEIIL